MSAIECARAILKYVSDINTAVVMVAIAGAESGWRLDAKGDYGYGKYNCDGYCSWGPWQVNICANYSWLSQSLGTSDPCAIAMWIISSYDNSAWAAATVLHRQGLCAWTVYEEWCSRDHKGTYRNYLDQARAAVQSVLQEGGVQPPGGMSDEERCIQAGGIWTGQECVFTPPPPLPITPLSFILVPITAALGSLSGAGLLFLWRKGISISEAKDILLRRIRHGR